MTDVYEPPHVNYYSIVNKSFELNKPWKHFFNLIYRLNSYLYKLSDVILRE